MKHTFPFLDSGWAARLLCCFCLFEITGEVISAPRQNNRTSAATTSTNQLKVNVSFDGYPENGELASRLRAIAVQAYPKVVELVMEQGEKCPWECTIVVSKRVGKKGAEVPARTFGTKIRMSWGYFEEKPAYLEPSLIHELVHVAQHWRIWSVFQSRPVCWVEGIANYVPFTLAYTNGFTCMGCALQNPDYTDGYSCAGAFLVFVAENHGRDVVRKLNSSVRHARFSEAFFKQETGKEFDTLWSEFQKTPSYTPLAAAINDYRQKFAFKAGRAPKGFQKRFDAYLANQFQGEALQQWHDALGYKAGKPAGQNKEYLLNDFAKFAFMNTLEGVGTKESYACMQKLVAENKVPWFSPEELRKAYVDLPEEIYTEPYGARTFLLTKAKDPFLYFYRVDCRNKEDHWKLVKVWRCKADGSSYEIFPQELSKD
jgi:Peptidase of plants and bacteria